MSSFRLYIRRYGQEGVGGDKENKNLKDKGEIVIFYEKNKQTYPPPINNTTTTKPVGCPGRFPSTGRMSGTVSPSVSV